VVVATALHSNSLHTDCAVCGVFVWQVAEAQIEYNCFQALQQQELLAAPDRIERMRLLVKGQRQREAELQQRYKQLCQQREDMREELAQLQQQQPGQGASKLAAAAAAMQATPVASNTHAGMSLTA